MINLKSDFKIGGEINVGRRRVERWRGWGLGGGRMVKIKKIFLLNIYFFSSLILNFLSDLYL